jgi:hypothetical protein
LKRLWEVVDGKSEALAQSEVGKRGRKRREGLIEAFAENQPLNSGGKVVDSLVVVIAECDLREATRDFGEWVVENGPKRKRFEIGWQLLEGLAEAL